ncbi:hypothetical protein ACTMU2_31680 [Cupriavidus basilensis]
MKWRFGTLTVRGFALEKRKWLAFGRPLEAATRSRIAYPDIRGIQDSREERT